MLMSVIVANDSSSGGSSSGSIDEATAASSSSSPPPPFPEGKNTLPQPLPPLVPPTPRKVNGAAAVNSPGAAGRPSDSSNPRCSTHGNNGKQRRGRKPRQRQQSGGKEGEGVGEGVGEGEAKGERWSQGAGGATNMTCSSSTLEEPRRKEEQEIRRLGKTGMWREALEVLGSIPEPSQREYVAAIAACDFAGEPRQAFRVHALMVEQGLKTTPESVLLVVRGLLLAGDAPTALRVFQSSGVRVRGRRYQPGLTSADSAMTMNTLYAVVIRAAQKAGDWREAVLLYREAEAANLGPTAATASTVFLACYAEKQYAAAASFASDALRPPWQEVTHRRLLTNKIIVACGRAGPDHYQQALDTYADLDRTIGVDGYTLTAVIDVLRRLGDWRRALPLLDRLAGLGVSANQGLRTSVNAVLSAMGPDNYRRAKELVEKAAVDWGVDGDIVTYGTLLLLASARLPPPAPLSSPGAAVVLPEAASAVAVEPRDPWSSPSRARPRGDGRSIEEGGTAADGMEHGKWETVNVFWRAVGAKAVPSEACLDMVVFALARDGLWEEASAFVRAIEEAGLTVSRHQREALLSALSNGGQWHDVVSLVEAMLAKLLVVDNPTAGLAMKAYANLGLKEHWRSAISLMKQAQRASAGSDAVADVLDASAWRLLLTGLASAGLNGEAGLAMQAMVEAGVPVDKDSSAAVVVAAYKAGDHAAAVAWVDRLRSAGLAISRNGYAAAVHACCALGDPDAAAGVLGVMSEAQVVPAASLYNAVLETICPPSEGGYSATVRLRDDAATPGGGAGEAGEEAESDSGGRGRRGGGGESRGGGGESRGGVAEINGLAAGRGGRGRGPGQAAKEGGRGEEPPEPEPPGGGRGSSAAEKKAESALALFEVMRKRKVPMNGVTYAMVVCALLGAEREGDVLRLWTQAWSDAGAKKLRRDMANRVLGICRVQRRGALAVRLLQLGARLVPKGREELPWPGPGPYWAAMEACEREGATAWRAALALADERETSPLPPDDLYSEAAAAIIQKAAAAGVADAVEAASTRAWQKRAGEKTGGGRGGGGGGGGGGRRAGRVRASAGATATAAVDQRAEAASAE
eukprot:g14726.t1